MSKPTATSSGIVPVNQRAIDRIDPPPARATGRMITITEELDVQWAVIAGEERKFQRAAEAATAVYESAQQAFVGLAERVVETQHQNRHPDAQRWVDWSVEQMMPQAGTDLARLARTGVFNIAETASRSSYQEPIEEREEPLSLVERVIGKRPR